MVDASRNIDLFPETAVDVSGDEMNDCGSDFDSCTSVPLAACFLV